MTNEEAEELAMAESVPALSAALNNIENRPTDFVVATAEQVFVGGGAEVTIDGETFRHTGDGTFTCHDRSVDAATDESSPVSPRVASEPIETGEVVSGAVHVEAAAPPAAPDVQPPPPPAPVVIPATVPNPPAPPGSAAPAPPDRVVPLQPAPVLVRGLLCQRDHLVHPEARMCPLCGDNMQNRSIVVNADGSVGELGPRPPLGVVILPDGRSYQLERSTVIGRLPEVHPDVHAGTADQVIIDGGELSRAHLRFVLDGWRVLIEDLGSTNGSWLGTGPSARQLLANSPVALDEGVDIYAGSLVLNYQPTSAAVS